MGRPRAEREEVGGSSVLEGEERIGGEGRCVLWCWSDECWCLLWNRKGEWGCLLCFWQRDMAVEWEGRGRKND